MAAVDKDIGRADSTLVSWNVRALNHPVKWSKVFNHLSKLKTEIGHLQQSILLNKDQSKLCRGFMQVSHSGFNSRRRRVAVLLHRDVQFRESDIIRHDSKSACCINAFLKASGVSDPWSP